MKPLEPGCMAVVIGAINHPDLIGKTVRCLSPVGPGHPTAYRGSWYVQGSWGPHPQFCLEKNLMRIDGHEGDLRERSVVVRRAHQS